MCITIQFKWGTLGFLSTLMIINWYYFYYDVLDVKADESR